MGVKQLKGYSRTKQIEWFSNHFDFDRDGHKYIIKKILRNDVLPMKDNRGGAYNECFTPQFMVSDELYNSIGIYKIQHNNKIYIGSTINGFRKRYLQHISDFSTSNAKEIIDNGIFKILEVCDGKEEKYIRELEQVYINFYKKQREIVVLNSRKAYSYYPKKTKYKALLVDRKQYDNVMLLLTKQQIKYKEWGK